MNSIPYKEIEMILNEVMNVAVANGADSRSMPDEYVAVAHFLCYPEEYINSGNSKKDFDFPK